MKKIIVLLSMVILVSSTLAEEEIQPFGGLLWDDSFVETIKKINAFNPDTLTIEILENSKDIMGVTSKDSLFKILGSLLKKSIPNLFKSNFKEKVKYNLITYSDTTKQEKNCYKTTYYIRAYPIMIEGVAFKLSANFEVMPGLSIVNPEKVLIDERKNISFPLVFRRVRLSTSSYKFNDKLKNINKVLKKKYSKFCTLGPESWDLLQIGASKSKSTSIKVVYSVPEYEINYYGSPYSHKIFEKYSQFEDSLETKRNADKKDFGSEL